MSLLKPGPGDLLDRAVILTIKVPIARAKGVGTDHLEEELAAIEQILAEVQQDRYFPHGRWEGWRKRLTEIHERLWDIIDALRLEHDDAFAARMGRDSIRLNDERSRIVREINVQCDADVGVEKLR